MTRKTRGMLILVSFVVFLIGVGGQGIQYWWRHGYSVGERNGVLRKLSVKGSPLCKYMAGELALSTYLPGGGGEIWEFTTDDSDEKDATVVALQEVARSGARVTLKYRQDRPMWWTCNPIQYKVVAVLK